MGLWPAAHSFNGAGCQQWNMPPRLELCRAASLILATETGRHYRQRLVSVSNSILWQQRKRLRRAFAAQEEARAERDRIVRRRING
jgi:hypothetical protein